MRLSRFWLLLVGCWLLSAAIVPAQTRKSAQRKSRTTQTQAKKKTASAKTGSKTQKTSTKSQKGKTKKAKTSQPTVQGLRRERQQLQKQIKEQEKKLQANRRNVKQQLEDLQIINTEIADKRRTIDTIRKDLTVLDGNIETMDIQLRNLEKRLNERKQNYMKSMRYMHRNRALENQLMFVFSAQNFTQMYRRMRFTREYAQYQRVQGEAVIVMQDQLEEAQKEMADAKRRKNALLYRGEQERKNLEDKQEEQQKVVSTLQKEQKTIEGIISEQRKKDAALNAQIDKLIAEEVARAKARAEAEAKRQAKRQAEARRKAAEEAARKRAEELARKKAAAEAAARENARRIAEAKAREERAKQQALAAARKSAEEKAAAERAAREAENARRAAERRAAEEARAHERDVAEMKRKEREEVRESFKVSTEDRKLSGNFESNRGRLPMPLTGRYSIVNGFGQNDVAGLRGVRINNKGINVKGRAGLRCSVFSTERSARSSILVASWGSWCVTEAISLSIPIWRRSVYTGDKRSAPARCWVPLTRKASCSSSSVRERHRRTRSAGWRADAYSVRSVSRRT